MVETTQSYGFEISPSGFIKVIIHTTVYDTSNNKIIANSIENVLLQPNNYELANSILPENKMNIVRAVWENIE